VIGALQAENEANVKLMSTLISWDLDIYYELANRPRIRSLDWDIVRGDLLAEIPRLGVEGIAFILPDGTLRRATDDGTAQVADRAYFKKAMAGEKNIDIVVNRVTNEPLLLMVVPIYESSARGRLLSGY
jgi:methyl-accepting chemotaxis protein